MTPRLQPHALTPLYRVRHALRERTRMLQRGQAWPLASIRTETTAGFRVPGAVVFWCAADSIPLTAQQVRQ